MEEKIYYIESSNELTDAMWIIENEYACFTEYENIEMNYVKITIQARTEDIKHIEEILAPLV